MTQVQGKAAYSGSADAARAARESCLPNAPRSTSAPNFPACTCSRFTGYSTLNCVIHGPTWAPTYPPVKCPDCGVWWRTPSHACIGGKP